MPTSKKENFNQHFLRNKYNILKSLNKNGRLDMAMAACDASTWEAGGSGVQGQSQLPSEVEARTQDCLNKEMSK